MSVADDDSNLSKCNYVKLTPEIESGIKGGRGAVAARFVVILRSLSKIDTKDFYVLLDLLIWIKIMYLSLAQYNLESIPESTLYVSYR